MANVGSTSELRLPLAFGWTMECMSDDRVDDPFGSADESASGRAVAPDTLARSALRRGARLASLPLGFAGRATLGLGKRLGGAPAEEVSEQLQQRAAEQVFPRRGSTPF